MYFIEHGTTTSSNYYIEHIIEPPTFFIYFPGDIQKKMMLHQDSALGHVSKDTVSYVKEHNTNVIMPHEWLLKSFDAVPKDGSICGVMKKRVRKHKMLTLKGLKNTIKVEWENFEQDLIDNALKYRTKSCRLIYYARGSHTKYLLQ